MKARLILISIFFSFFANGLAQAQEKLDLMECYQFALKRGEAVEISKEEIRLAQARFKTRAYLEAGKRNG